MSLVLFLPSPGRTFSNKHRHIVKITFAMDAPDFPPWPFEVVCDIVHVAFPLHNVFCTRITGILFTGSWKPEMKDVSFSKP
jgi:hypothetical protein